MSREIILQAPAKINWRLDVLGRRPDGYHELHSIMQSVSLFDTVILRRAADSRCICQPEPCREKDNLAFRAWSLLQEKFAIPEGLHIMIEKRIPSGGGLAGGSADAAAVLLGAARLFDLGLSLPQLQELGFGLGADIPYCLCGGLAEVRGAGENVKPCTEQVCRELLLICPGIVLSTGAVFAAFDALAEKPAASGSDKLLGALVSGDRQAVASEAGNMLEPAAFKLCPRIKKIRNMLDNAGCISLMSGSGSCIWALPPLDEAATAEITAKLEAENIQYYKVHTLSSGIELR